MLLPQDFLKEMSSLMPEDELQRLENALQEPPSISIRPNPFKPSTLPLPKQSGSIAWSSLGYYLSQRPQFTLDPLLHSGAYYVQEASSMFIEQAIARCEQPKVVLDLCAAPGGKSTLLRSVLPEDCLLVCNEPLRHRANILRENILKWGHEQTLVANNYPIDYGNTGALFDVICVDAPCSGEGMFRKDNPALELWSTSLVADCAQKQHEIVSDVWPALKKGGFLIYSTCTYNTLENENNIRYICDKLGATPIEIPIPKEWGIAGSLVANDDMPVYRFMPHRVKGEGLFFAILRKDTDVTNIKTKTKTTLRPIPKEWADRISKNRSYLLMQLPNEGWAIPANNATIIELLCQNLRPLSAGIPLYYHKGNKTIPHHALAMSRCIKRGSFFEVELSLEDALAYLRHNTLKVSAPNGYVLLTYGGLPLGFCNNIGSRANNMYPQEWKIKH